jgi:hypothetical protein
MDADSADGGENPKKRLFMAREDIMRCGIGLAAVAAQGGLRSHDGPVDSRMKKGLCIRYTRGYWVALISEIIL